MIRGFFINCNWPETYLADDDADPTIHDAIALPMSCIRTASTFVILQVVKSVEIEGSSVSS
jgi:hypothetical protein